MLNTLWRRLCNWWDTLNRVCTRCRMPGDVRLVDIGQEAGPEPYCGWCARLMATQLRGSGFTTAGDEVMAAWRDGSDV